MTARRAACVGLLSAALVAALMLTFVVSYWFFPPVPLLAAAVYAAYLGMTPARFADALDDPRSGGGTVFPL